MSIHVIEALVGYFLFSAAAGALEEPSKEQRGRFYGWFYRFAQRLAANADRVAAARFGPLAATATENDSEVAVATSSTSVATERTVVVAQPAGDQH